MRTTELLVCVFLCGVNVITGDLIYSVFKQLDKNVGCEFREDFGYCDPMPDPDVDVAKVGTVCSVPGQKTYFRCHNDGEWVKAPVEVQHAHRRKKRGWFRRVVDVVLPVIPIVGPIACSFLCSKPSNGGGGGDGQQPNSFPLLTCPSIATQVAETGRSKIVSWEPPKGQDKEDKEITAEQTSGLAPGSVFEEGTHVISYRVVDSGGLPATCQTIFNVKPKYCRPELLYPRHGTKRCGDGAVSGSTCSFDCDEGYQLEGSALVTCVGENWDTDEPKCNAISCGSPPVVDEGSVTCLGDTVYGTYCLLTCNRGYESQGLLVSTCTSSGQWTQPGTCVDADPPRFLFGCPSDVTEYAGKKNAGTTVTWEDPQVSDNDDVTSLTFTSSPEKGSLFDVGQTRVQLLVTDAAGNQAGCTFNVNIISRYCDQPSVSDDKMRYDCPDGHGYGYSCTLSCSMGYPLSGPDTILCDTDHSDSLTWTWPDDTIEPFCKVTQCATLPFPANGALSCDEWQKDSWMCTMLCEDPYDVAAEVPDLYVCGVSGAWSPSSTVRDCTETRLAGDMRMMTAFHYYSGACGDAATQQEIAENFLLILKDGSFSFACGPSVPECRVENVNVQCGARQKRDVGDRRKKSTRWTRSTHETIVEVDFYYKLDRQHGETVADAIARVKGNLNQVKSDIDQMATNGQLDQDGLIVEADSPRSSTPELFCPNGEPNYARGSCRGCAKGTYSDGGQCKDCPIGSYSDTDFASSCTSCGGGFSTKTMGSKSPSNCTGLCLPGTHSVDGMEPCTPCPPGSYQSSSGSMTCSSCPTSTWSHQGTTQSDQCLGFDFNIGASTEVKIGEVNSDLSSLTLTYWSRINTITGHTLSTVRNMAGNIQVQVKLDGNLIVEIAGETLDTGVSASTERWQHLTVTVAGGSGDVRVYVDGVQVSTTTLSSLTDPVVSASSVVSSSAADGGISLSGYSVLDRVISPSEIQTTAGSCGASFADSRFIIQGDDQHIVLPSLCDDVDNCADSPCGTHLCEDEIGKATCRCEGGWTGETCATPPDFCADNECQNNAVCENGNTNYTCKCQKGFKGDLCQVGIVNGQFSPWVQWSPCSQSCGGGTRDRSRDCDSPPPDEDGDDCVGARTETSFCNTQQCPSCPILRLSYGNVRTCQDKDGTEFCNVTCRNGTVFDNNDIVYTYECGIRTNYTWNHRLLDPEAMPPSCKRATGAVGYTVNHSMQYSTLPCSTATEHQSDVMGTFTGFIGDLHCVQNNECSAHTSLTNCDQSGVNKRSVTSTTVTITVNITMATDISEDIAVYSQTGTVTDNLRAYVLHVLNTDYSIQQLVNTSDTELQLVLGGTTYSVDPDSINTQVSTVCPVGSVPAEDICALCPVGTRQESTKCVLCERGEYQDQEASSSCKTCPSGTTTSGAGATQISDCSVNDGDHEHPHRHDDEDEHRDRGDKSQLIVIISTSILGAVLLTVAVAFIIWRLKRKGNKSSPSPSVADLPPQYSEYWVNPRRLTASSIKVVVNENSAVPAQPTKTPLD